MEIKKVSANLVRLYAEDQFKHKWGSATNLEIEGVDFPIEWVDRKEPPDDNGYLYGNEDINVVFKVTIDEEDRFFVKEGYYASHSGEVWDGPFYEAEPVQVTKFEYRRVR